MEIAEIIYERDGVHEGDVDLDRFSNQILNLAEHGEVVLGLDIFGVRGVQAGNQATQRGDTDTLSDTKDRYHMVSPEHKLSAKVDVQVSMWVAPASRAV